MYSTANVACKNWHPGTMSGTYLPQNTQEASYAIFPINPFMYRTDLLWTNLGYDGPLTFSELMFDNYERQTFAVANFFVVF